MVESHSCHPKKATLDYLLWGSLVPVLILYLHTAIHPQSTGFIDVYQRMAGSVYELVNMMWWGVLVGVLMLSLLTVVPREFVMSALGTQKGLRGIARATFAGVLLDLCSHGILMVGAKLYERGASLGQVMAFLIASPWNSFSLTLILIALIGLKWTLLFILLSMLIALVTGCLFELFVSRGVLPANPHRQQLDADFRFWPEAMRQLKAASYSPRLLLEMVVQGVRESRMVIRWVLFGILLASLVRTFLDAHMFETWFGPTMLGLAATMLAATIIEVCSEGSTPIAADLLNRAQAPGNGFAFLMTGVTTDYTEIMVMKETTKSFKAALFLPLLAVPQVLLVALLVNSIGV